MSTVEPIRNLEDLRKVENVLARNPRDLLLFTIGTNCGLRISNILALNVSDVKGCNYIQITEKKTGKFKKFPINAKLKPMLYEFTKRRKPKEPLFVTKSKNRLERVAAYKIINRACKEVGLEKSVGTHKSVFFNA